MKNKTIILLGVITLSLFGFTSFSGTASASTYYIYSPRWVGAAVSAQLGPYFTGDSITLRSDGSSCAWWSIHRYHLGYYPAHKQPSLDHVSPEFYKSYDEPGGCRTITLHTELAGQPAGNYVLSFPPGYSGYNGGTPSFCAFSWDGTPAYISNCGVEKNPVLIVPGLMGTEMYNNGSEKLWLDSNRNFTDIGDEFMDPLAFSGDLNPTYSSLSIGDIIRKPNIIFDYSEGLIQELKNQGYIENQDLFTFPYDWRYGVSGKYPDGKTNSDLLKEKIQDILTQTGGDKVDVIAHSLGGLVVKKYAIDNSVSHYIGKAIFVGVPNTGAPKSIKALLQGDNFGIPWLSESEIKKISANM